MRADKRGDRTTNIATPIFNGEELLAVVNVSYFKSQVAESDVHRDLTMPLLQFAKSIEHEVGQRMAGRFN